MATTSDQRREARRQLQAEGVTNITGPQLMDRARTIAGSGQKPPGGGANTASNSGSNNGIPVPKTYDEGIGYDESVKILRGKGIGKDQTYLDPDSVAQLMSDFGWATNFGNPERIQMRNTPGDKLYVDFEERGRLLGLTADQVRTNSARAIQRFQGGALYEAGKKFDAGDTSKETLDLLHGETPLPTGFTGAAPKTTATPQQIADAQERQRLGVAGKADLELLKGQQTVQATPEQIADAQERQRRGVASAKDLELLKNAPQQTAGGQTGQDGKQPTPLNDPSVVNFLVAVGMPYDYNSRAQMARERGITGYTGTAAQNTRLLNMLRQEHGAGTLGKETPDETPAPTTTTKTEGQVDQNSLLNEINRINEEANKAQSDELDEILKETDKVDLSGSAELVKKLTEVLETRTEDVAKQPSAEEQFNAKRAELGIDPIESELKDLDTQLKQLDADYTSTLEDEEGRLVSMGTIRKRQSAQDLKYNRLKRDLMVERDSVANQLNQKYSVLDSMMKFANMDYERAQDAYNTQFNQTIQLTNMLKGIEDTAKTDIERKVDNARANVQMMHSLLQSGNMNYDELDDTTKVSIYKMELQAGLPIGFTQYVTKEIDKPFRHIGASFTDASGNRVQPILVEDENGNLVSQNIIVGKAKYVGGGGGGGKGTKKPVETSGVLSKEEFRAQAQAEFRKSFTESALDALYDEYLAQIEANAPAENTEVEEENEEDDAIF